jgi:hypothetical protein
VHLLSRFRIIEGQDTAATATDDVATIMGKGVGAVAVTGHGISGDLMEDLSRFADLQNGLATRRPTLMRFQLIIAMSLYGSDIVGLFTDFTPNAIW